jgi:rubrerythrin
MDERMKALIGTAIAREEEAFTFYRDILNKVKDDGTKETIEWIANEEKKHKAFLVDFREGNISADAMKLSDVVYYKIAEYQEEPAIEREMSREDIFLLASHRENRSYQVYAALADLVGEGEARTMLSKMANEELKHKEKMEYLYTNTAFPQTAGG